MDFIFNEITASDAFLCRVGEHDKGPSLLLAKSGETEPKYILFLLLLAIDKDVLEFFLQNFLLSRSLKVAPGAPVALASLFKGSVHDASRIFVAFS